MKIIKQGKLNKPQEVKQFECKKCGCVFKADNDEYLTKSYYNELYYVCLCPNCENNCYYSEN